MFYGQMNQHKKYLKKNQNTQFEHFSFFFINQFNYQENNAKINDFMFHTRILKIFQKEKKKKFILDENLKKLKLLRKSV